jgi:hypothetical protein
LHNLAGDILCAVGGAGNLNLAGDRCDKGHFRGEEGLREIKL